MTDWLHSRPIRVVKLASQAAFYIAWFIELGIVIFGGAHVAIYHAVPAGYVRIHAIGGRFASGHMIYVSPWVARLHHWAFPAIFVSLAPFLMILIAEKIAKARDKG